MAAVVCKPLFFFCLSQAVRKKSAANRRKQNLINLYLRECAESGKTLAMKWG